MKCIFYYDVQNIKILEPATSLFQKEEGTNDADLLHITVKTKFASVSFLDIF
jgi:hypothetical protein